MESEIGSAIAEGLGSTPAPAPVIDPSAAPAAPASTTGAPLATPVADPALAAPAIAVPSAEPAKQESIPLAAFLDMRDENKRLKAEVAKANEARPAAPVQVPSFKDDPDGFAAYVSEQTNRTAVGTRFEVSELTAREKHGDDLVTEAMAWGMDRSQESPAFAAEYLKQKNPISWAVKQMKRAKLMDEIGDDEDAFIQTRAEKLGFVKAAPVASAAAPASQPQAQVPAPQQPAPQAAPSRSLASAPSAGGPQIVPSGDFAAFDAINPGQ